MKSAIIAGLIAGIVYSIVQFVFEISGLWELFSGLPHVFPHTMQSMAILNIIMGVIWGIIWSAFYAFFYEYIPAKGIKKGLIYGLIIWTIAIFRPVIIAVAYGYYSWAIPSSFAGFFSIAITYGLLIGYLYKK